MQQKHQIQFQVQFSSCNNLLMVFRFTNGVNVNLGINSYNIEFIRQDWR
jgi:hypothetical protein